MSEIRRCIVTGYNGFLGSAVVRALQAHGVSVYGMGRKPCAGLHWIPFDLTSVDSIQIPSGIDAVVHCAWDFAARGDRVWEINGVGTLALLETARQAGVTTRVFVSSMSASANTRSDYGRAKARLEASLIPGGTICVRPGLITGNSPHSVFSTISRLVTIFSIIPIPEPSDGRFYLCTVDDVAESIVHLLSTQKVISKPVIIASKTARSIRDIVLLIAKKQQRRRLLVSIPSHFIIACLTLAERFRLPTPIRADSARALIATENIPTHSVDWSDVHDPFGAAPPSST